MKLETTRDMCEFLAAAGRNSYTKSLLLHLQQMTKLEIQHPEVYHHFMNGFHSIWRSEREWAGLSPDYVIESVLMRSLKTSGGLTRGRGMLRAAASHFDIIYACLCLTKQLHTRADRSP